MPDVESPCKAPPYAGKVARLGAVLMRAYEGQGGAYMSPPKSPRSKDIFKWGFSESGPLRAFHLSRHKRPGGLCPRYLPDVALGALTERFEEAFPPIPAASASVIPVVWLRCHLPPV